MPTKPIAFQIRNVGIIVTAPGSIIDASTRAKRADLPRKRKYEKPHATIADEMVTVVAASTVTISVLISQRATGASAQTCT